MKHIITGNKKHGQMFRDCQITVNINYSVQEVYEGWLYAEKTELC